MERVLGTKMVLGAESNIFMAFYVINVLVRLRRMLLVQHRKSEFKYYALWSQLSPCMQCKLYLSFLWIYKFQADMRIRYSA